MAKRSAIVSPRLRVPAIMPTRIVHAVKYEGDPVYWISEAPDACDICGQPIKDAFADAKTSRGPWGSLDLKCLRVHGIGTGKGKGQVYRRQDDGRWLKVAG
jgi:hypothetical protein